MGHKTECRICGKELIGDSAIKLQISVKLSEWEEEVFTFPICEDCLEKNSFWYREE